MRSRLRLPSPAMCVALLALFVAVGGSSYAALKVGSKQIVNNSIRGKDIRNRTVRGKDVGRNALTGGNIVESSLGAVPRANAAGTATTAGSAARATTAGSANPELFAHVNVDGTVDAANSKGVSSANISTDGDSTYCFHGLAYQPRGAQVTIDYQTAGSSQLIQFSLGTVAGCPAGTQAFVYGVTASTGSSPTGFYIVFYR